MVDIGPYFWRGVVLMGLVRGAIDDLPGDLI